MNSNMVRKVCAELYYAAMQAAMWFLLPYTYQFSTDKRALYDARGTFLLMSLSLWIFNLVLVKVLDKRGLASRDLLSSIMVAESMLWIGLSSAMKYFMPYFAPEDLPQSSVGYSTLWFAHCVLSNFVGICDIYCGRGKPKSGGKEAVDTVKDEK